MRFVACSGFPVPVSRYWKEFPAVEIAETELGIPGVGTVGRWLRESPENFGFSLLAPKHIAEGAFERTAESQIAIREITALAKKVQAKAVIFVGHPEWKPNRPRRVAIKAFIDSLPAKGPNFVLDLPAWPAEEVRNVAKDAPLFVAYDPLVDDELPQQKLAYMRLLGPAGHRSRYDDAALERLARACVASTAKTVFCSFRNIDMYANAKRLLQLIKGLERNTEKAQGTQKSV